MFSPSESGKNLGGLDLPKGNMVTEGSGLSLDLKDVKLGSVESGNQVTLPQCPFKPVAR